MSEENEQEVSLEEVERKLEQMKIKDIEVSGGRNLKGILGNAVFLIGIVMSLFHIVVLTVRPIDPWYFRSLHVLFGGILVYAFVPGWKKSPKNYIHFLDYLLMICLVAPVVYMFIVFDEWIYRVGVIPTTWDFVFSVMFIFAVIEMARRASGWPLAILCMIFILYGYLGNHLPGIFQHRGYPLDRIATFLFSLDGILGLPILASAHYIFLFVLFGAFVEASGAGKFFVDFARSLAGKFRGGPAKVSIVSSALIGTASGSSVANVVVDGVLNIPLMKASGFRPATAGAIEAMNSTGGQIVPPVMGAGAFLMAEILGVPYPKVALAAIIPAVLYYFAAYWMIDFYAASNGLSGAKKENLPVFKRIMMERGFLLIPLVVLLFSLMVLMYSPYRSAMYAIVAMIVVAAVKPETRFSIKKIFTTLSKGGKGSMEIIATCAAAGIIVGILTQTGLGMKFAMIIITYSGGSLLLSLIFTMIIAIVLGMGMPTTAAYAISASVLAPALIQLNVSPIAAHLFIFYFACLSAITPPVALASFAAAAIANAKTWDVALEGMKFAIAGYIVPFMFVYGPALVLEGPWQNIALASVTAVLGTAALAGSIQGWFLTRTIKIERLLLFAAALTLIKPGIMTDMVGFGLAFVVLVSQLIRKRKKVAAA